MKGVSLYIYICIYVINRVFRLRSREATSRKAVHFCISGTIETMHALAMRASRGMRTGRLVWRRKSSGRKNLSGRTLDFSDYDDDYENDVAETGSSK